MIMKKCVLAATFFSAAIFSAAAHAAWEAGAGVETYLWQEYTTGTNGIAEKPTERGPRLALHLNWTQDGEQGLLFAYYGKLYAGQVNYDTYNLHPDTPNIPDTPLSTTTLYLGAAHEARILYRNNLASHYLDFVGGIGWDNWRRVIDSQIEDYFILYLRGGINFDQHAHGTGWHGGGGLKLPIWTRENAHLTDQGFTSNPLLEPGKDISLYAELGYRIDSHLNVVAYYDSWRFKQSDLRTSNQFSTTYQSWKTYQIWQPKSSMDLLGVRAMYAF